MSAPQMLSLLKRPRIASLGIVFLALFFGACSTQPNVQQQLQGSAAPAEVVRQFYDWYLHTRFPDPREGNEATFRKYVTARLLKQSMAPDVDAVLFIDAQDADPTWANDFSVGRANVRGDQTTTEIALNGKKVHATLQVFLKRENGAWKIDNVKRSGWKAVEN